MKILSHILPILILGCFSCSDHDDSPLQKSEFRLAVLNEDMERVNVIEEGKNFYIGLELINNSSDTISFSYGDSNRLITQFINREDFLLIYRTDATGLIPIGKPYNPEVDLNFVASNVPPIKIPPFERSVFVLGFNWFSNTENKPLEVGNYYSSFKDKVVVDNVEMDINTAIEFEVK